MFIIRHVSFFFNSSYFIRDGVLCKFKNLPFYLEFFIMCSSSQDPVLSHSLDAEIYSNLIK